MNKHDKKTLANEYCLCRNIPHRWVGGIDAQLIIGDKNGKAVIYSIYNLPYSEIIPTLDNMCEYDEFGRFVRVTDVTPSYLF